MADLFLIDHNKWPEICKMGMNAAVAYLVLARGSGPDNSSTSWSANSIEQRTGISRKRAGEAIKLLGNRNQLSQSGTRARPQYKLSHTAQPSWVYLPNTLIDGAAVETPPIERLRRRGSIEALRMLIDAYQMQDLANDDGMDWRLVHSMWERTKITDQGHWQISGFSPTNKMTAPWHCPLRAQFNNQTSEDNMAFWDAFQILQNCGLLETVPYLAEGSHEGAELIFPLDRNGSDAEMNLYEAATDAARAMLEGIRGFEDQLDNHEIALPVSNDFPNAIVVGVFRLRYRAKTKLTAAWWSKQGEWKQYASQYRDLFGGENVYKMTA
jgi:hypothetical protein